MEQGLWSHAHDCPHCGRRRTFYFTPVEPRFFERPWSRTAACPDCGGAIVYRIAYDPARGAAELAVFRGA